MSVDQIVHVVVGLAVFISVLLMHFSSPAWGWVAGFLGLSLAQSGFTGICPLSFALRKLGFKEHDASCGNA
ncbi:MAG: rhodanese [Hydrogenophilales bacterium 17-64-11]|nr:MAG: rhodanese [Hydrogenophilales bacterium 17-64-11]